MSKHAKIVPITARRLKPQESPKEVSVPIRNGSFVQLSFSELLTRYFQQQKEQETAQAETRSRKRGKTICLPKRSSDDSCSA